MHTVNVEKPSIQSETSLYITKLTQERNLMVVLYVGNLLLSSYGSLYIREHTPG